MDRKQDVKQLILQILEEGYLMSLATLDDGGVWVSDVIYVHDDALTIYWLSHAETRHSKAITGNPRVAGTITVDHGPTGRDRGIQFEGIAEKVDGDVLPIAIRHRAKRGKPPPAREGEILDPGESWYRLRPTKIELIHEPFFGFKKQVLVLGDSHA